VNSAPCIKPQPIAHAPHAHAIIDTPAALGAPDEEEGCLRTVSPRGEQATEWLGLGLGRTLLERRGTPSGCQDHYSTRHSSKTERLRGRRTLRRPHRRCPGWRRTPWANAHGQQRLSPRPQRPQASEHPRA
jgi:hypothetical protein